MLGRLDDLAQDIEHLELDDQVWEVVERLAKDADASHELSVRLKRLSCDYCGVANPVAKGVASPVVRHWELHSPLAAQIADLPWRKTTSIAPIAMFSWLLSQPQGVDVENF